MLNVETRRPVLERDGANTRSVRTLVEFSMDQVDRSLPAWARRANPIVRRHLGAYWKTFTPDVSALVRIYGVLVAVTAVTILVPLLYTLLVPTVTVSLVMLPFGAYVYASVLYQVGAFAAGAAHRERRQATLDVLRATPFRLRTILLSKGAAAVWRSIEDVNLVTLIALLTSLPLLLIVYHAALRPLESPLLVGLVVAAALASFTLRIFLETALIAALGLLMGTVNATRSGAVLSTSLITLGYFGLINLARLLPFGAGWLIVIELVLPLILPILLAWLLLVLTARIIEAD
ncbi:MAG: hypothetical protein SF162_10330 [bacterium]|nr:hypothetical protein [bacterium]